MNNYVFFIQYDDLLNVIVFSCNLWQMEESCSHAVMQSPIRAVATIHHSLFLPPNCKTAEPQNFPIQAFHNTCNKVSDRKRGTVVSARYKHTVHAG
jgi:hypothetical protein